MALSKIAIATCVLAILAVAAGCPTPGGGSSTGEVAAATHRIAQRLSNNVNDSLQSLNANAADLSARLEEYDRQVRQLRLTVEDNQVRLDSVQQRLDELSATLYSQLNLTPPASAAPRGSADVWEDEIRITPPSQR